MEPGSGPLDGIRRVFGFRAHDQKRRGGRNGEFAQHLAKERPGKEPPSEDTAEKTMEQGATGSPAGPRHVFEDPRRERPGPGRGTDDGKGLKVDVLA